ncbi:AI-2E family transporter [Candidatus Levyibacteriota bacterium]|nr:AI-2E family transporter [Candidatus Levybacteria bacterium]
MRLFKDNIIINAIIFVFLLWFIYTIQELLISIFIAYIIASALNSFIDFLEINGIPRWLGVLLSFISITAGIAIIIIPLIPFLLSQMQSLLTVLPQYIEQLIKITNSNIDTNQVKGFIFDQINTWSQNIFGVTKAVFGGFFNLLLILFISFNLLIDRNKIGKYAITLFPENLKDKIIKSFILGERQLGAWLRGQITLCIFMGLITWIALSMLHFEFALPLALLVSLFEAIPTIGPIISSIPAIIIAMTISPQMTAIIIIIYVGMNMLENNILVPKIMEKAVGIHPVIIVLSIAIGAKLLGILGALLAVPFISLVFTFYIAMREK